jgi:isopentenyldiphosphate isomerase
MERLEERIDLCDPRGRPTGRSRTRAEVHRDGDWHRSFHCWVVSPDRSGCSAIVLQRRAATKDTWPNLWDVSVAGHYAAGEGIEGGLREIQEELGLTVAWDELVQVGWRREEVFYPSGLIEREVQDVYFLWRDVDLTALQPDPQEVSGVVLVPPGVLAGLGRGALERCRVAGVRVGASGLGAESIELRPELLVPRAGDYYGKVTRLVVRTGGQPPSVLRRRWW